MTQTNSTWSILVLLALICHPVRGFSQKYFVPRVPDTLEKYQDIEFFLITAGVGSDLASRFGHTGIRIIDPYQGQRAGGAMSPKGSISGGRLAKSEAQDVVYNWGKFSFNDPGFIWKFFRGSLVYSMGVRTFANDVGIYQDANRFLVMEPLVMTLLQKRDLYERIARNAQPENREFSYQYWFKNCSTIPRDLIDAMTHGGVKAALGSEPAERVFRDYVIRNLSAIPLVAPGLDIMMNGNIDRPINKWEEMFLPEKLRQHLQSLPAFDDQGRPIPGTKLLGESKILAGGPENYQRLLPDYLLLIGPVWLAIGWYFFRRIRGLSSLKSASPTKPIGLGLIYYGALFGFLGFILVFNWVLSGHPDGWANKNLLFFWPTDFVYCWLGVRLVKNHGPIKNRLFLPRDITFYTACKLGATLYFLLTLISPEVPWLGEYQNMTRIFLWFGTGTLIMLPTFVVGGISFSPHPYIPVDKKSPSPLPQSLAAPFKKRSDS
jgi:hypothetical protein